MPDQDWGTADGTAGSAGNGSARGAARGRTADADPAHIVPFPGDWFGAVAKFWPTTLDLPENGLDATAFWDGDAGATEEFAALPGEQTADRGASTRGAGRPGRTPS